MLDVALNLFLFGPHISHCQKYLSAERNIKDSYRRMER